MTNAVLKLYDVLPDFANDENREKHAMIKAKTSQLEALESDCKDLQDRFGVLKDHLKNVQTEVTSVEQLVTQKEIQAKEEKHLQSLTERERGKIRVDYEKVANETEDVQAKWSIIQGKMQVAQNRINKFKEDMQINQKELEQWESAAKQKEEDFRVIKQYQKSDESKVKAMIFEVEKAAVIVENKKNELDQEITNTRSLQIELDTTADYFRKIHEERARLLAQWEATLKQVQALNSQIEQAQAVFDSRTGEADKYHKSIAEEKRNLDLASSANAQIERQLTIGDHQVSTKHALYEKEDKQIAEFSEVVATQRQKLDKLDSDIRAYNEHIADYRNKTAQEIARKEELLQRLAETENAFSLQKDYTKDITGQTDLMNEMMKKQEAQIKDLDTQIDDTKKQIFKLSQDVFEMRKQEKLLIAEIQGSQSRNKNLQQRIKEFDKETQKQLELLYNSNFSIAQMERKISMIQGNTTQEEKIELQKQLEELEKNLASKEELQKVLNLQLHRLELDLRKESKRKESLTKVNTELSSRLNELVIDQDSLDKSVVKTHKLKEQALVQLNMLRLQVQKLSSQVEAKCDEVISLENRREQLQLSLQERMVELEEHLSGLKVQLKTEQEAKHKAIVELAERKKRETTLGSKYDIVMGNYALDGEENTQAYHVIKSAKEREEITKRGDELEEEVKMAIKQLRSLEREMEKLNIQTDEFKKGFQTADDAEQIEKKQSLEEQLRAAQQKLNSKKAESRSIEEEKQAMDRTYLQKQEQIQTMQIEINKMQPIIEKLRGENKELKDKLQRANLALKRARETHRKDENVPFEAPYPSTLFEMNVEMQMARQNINSLVTELTKLAEGNREVEPKLSLGLSQLGLQMLHTPKPPSGINAPNSARSGHSFRSGASFRSNGTTPNSARSRVSNISKGSNGSQSSQVSGGSHVSVHQLEFPGI